MHTNLNYLVAQQHIHDLHTTAVRERLAQAATSNPGHVHTSMVSGRRSWRRSLRPLLGLPVFPSSEH